MKQLDAAEQRQLLAIARRAIETAVRHGPRAGVVDGSPSAGIAEPAAAFVTMANRHRQELRLRTALPADRKKGTAAP